MGPWPGDHGNIGSTLTKTCVFCGLQWGRGLVTTEIRHARDAGARG